MKNEINILQATLAEATEGLEQPKLGEKMLEVIHPYAGDFLKIFEKREIKPILGHPFSQWFNSHKSIAEAYELMTMNGHLSKDEMQTPVSTSLEFITASGIHFLIGSKIIYGDKNTRRAIVPQKKQASEVTVALKVLKQKLNLHQGIYSKLESKQYLLRELVDDILNDNGDYCRSIYSSGTTNSHLIRTLLSKRIMHGLFSLLKKKNPEPRLIAMIMLKVTGLFFTPMDASDATDLAKEIQANVIEDEAFRNQSINDYLIQSLARGKS